SSSSSSFLACARLLFVLGRPKAGKSTLCQMLESEYHRHSTLVCKHLDLPLLLKTQSLSEKDGCGDAWTVMLNQIELWYQGLKDNQQLVVLIEGWPTEYKDWAKWYQCFQTVDLSKYNLDILGLIQLDCSLETLNKRLDTPDQTLSVSDYDHTLPVLEEFGVKNLLFRVSSMAHLPDLLLFSFHNKVALSCIFLLTINNNKPKKEKLYIAIVRAFAIKY
ncbi:hypothetical protein RFI_18512, partial [Reticulomyxa filosa]